MLAPAPVTIDSTADTGEGLDWGDSSHSITPPTMHPELEYLSHLLDEASELLSAHGATQWADWLSKDARLIRASDFYGIEHLLSAFGGMGSFNDVVLCSASDGGNPARMLIAENDRLSELRTSIYDTAKKLAREESP
jgi:hypothetical protein